MASKDLDLNQAVNTFISDHVDLFTTMELGNKYSPGMALNYMVTPTGPGTRYYNGIRKQEFAFSITAKHPNGLKALNTLNAIMELMNDASHVSIKSHNNSFKFINAEIAESPHQILTVQDDDKKDAQIYQVYQGVFKSHVILL